MRHWKASCFFVLVCPAAWTQALQSTTVVTAETGFGYIDAMASASWPGDCTGMDGFGDPLYGTTQISSLYVDCEGSPSLGCDSDGYVPPGTYTISANYSGFTSSSGSCNVNGSSASTSAVVPHGETQLYPTFNLPVKLQVGEILSAQFDLDFDDVYGISFPYPTGDVQLLYGGQAVATAPLGSLGDGTGTYFEPTIIVSTKGLPTGTYTLFAEYPGDSNYAYAESSPLTVTLLPAQMATTTGLTVTPNLTVEGGTIEVAVAVTPTGVTVPSGTVTLLANDVAVGTIPLNSGSGALSFPANVPAGTYTVQAVYGGDSYNIASTSSTVSLTVDAQSSTSTAVTLSPSTVVAGASTLLTVTVIPTIASVVPNGTVTVTANGVAVADLTLKNGTASEELSTAGVPSGTYSIVGKYSGNSQASASTSSTATLVVSAASTVSLTASPNPVVKGSVTTLTATVKNSSGAPVTSGTVTFSYAGSTLGTTNVGSNGQASLPIGTNSFAAGSYTITASFSGSGNVPAATGAVTLAVN